MQVTDNLITLPDDVPAESILCGGIPLEPVSLDAAGAPVEGDAPFLAMPYGLWKHPKHGPMELTREKAIRMADNFRQGVYGPRLPINYGHDRGGRAAGWVKDIDPREEAMWVYPAWTPPGREAVKNGEYGYTSVEFYDLWEHPKSLADGGDGMDLVRYQDVLIGVGLTNVPFLKGHPGQAQTEVHCAEFLGADKSMDRCGGGDWVGKAPRAEEMDDEENVIPQTIDADVPAKQDDDKGPNARKSPPKDYPKSKGKYADPADFKYPVDTPEHVRAAWSYINMPKNQKGYSPAQVASIKSRIRAAAGKLGVAIKADDDEMNCADPKGPRGARIVDTFKRLLERLRGLPQDAKPEDVEVALSEVLEPETPIETVETGSANAMAEVVALKAQIAAQAAQIKTLADNAATDKASAAKSAAKVRVDAAIGRKLAPALKEDEAGYGAMLTFAETNLVGFEAFLASQPDLAGLTPKGEGSHETESEVTLSEADELAAGRFAKLFKRDPEEVRKDTIAVKKARAEREAVSI